MAKRSLPFSVSAIKTCSVDGCDRRWISQGLCTTHYYHFGVRATCSIDGCDKYVMGHGFCNKHYARWKKHGDPHIATFRVGVGSTPEDKFWSKVNVSEDADACWEWKGATHDNGYGSAGFGRRKWLAHRLAFYLTHHYDAVDRVLHSCDNPPCCNPNHLREGTDQDNADDRVARNRQLKGEQTHFSVLTEPQVVEIRKMLAEGIKGNVIAKHFNVSKNAISLIKTGQTWRHVQ